MAKGIPKVVSKNARQNIKTQKFFCPCGGEIQSVSVFSKGKLKIVARCNKCGAQKRKPSDFDLII
jgi:transcription elongation factor Elf1